MNDAQGREELATLQMKRRTDMDGTLKDAYGHEALTAPAKARKADMDGTFKTLLVIEVVKLAVYLVIAAVAYTAFGLW
jgi:hypothetical protein